MYAADIGPRDPARIGRGGSPAPSAGSDGSVDSPAAPASSELIIAEATATARAEATAVGLPTPGASATSVTPSAAVRTGCFVFISFIKPKIFSSESWSSRIGNRDSGFLV